MSAASAPASTEGRRESKPFGKTVRGKSQAAIAFLGSTIFLFLIWTSNPFGAVGVLKTASYNAFMKGGPGDFKEGSNAILVETVLQRRAGVAPSTFMLLPDLNRIKEVGAFLGASHPRMGKTAAPYYSQFGLQADVADWFAKVAGDPVSGLVHFRSFVTLAAAAAASVFIAWLFNHAGPWSALSVMLIMGFADWMIYLSQSIYFVVFLNILAFAIPWFLLCSERKRFILFLAVHGAIVFIRSLCGYEFISCLILAPLPAITYSVVNSAQPLAVWLRMSALCCFVGIFSFGLAIGSHWSKAVFIEKLQPENALAFLTHRSRINTSLGYPPSALVPVDRELKSSSALYRTVNKLGFEGLPAANIFAAANAVAACLSGHFITFPGGVLCISNGIYLAFFFACFGWFTVRRKRLAASPTYRSVVTWLATSAAAILSSFSWYVLAINHSLHHTFYVLICLFFAFIPVATVFCVKLMSLERELRRNQTPQRA